MYNRKFSNIHRSTSLQGDRDIDLVDFDQEVTSELFSSFHKGVDNLNRIRSLTQGGNKTFSFQYLSDPITQAGLNTRLVRMSADDNLLKGLSNPLSLGEGGVDITSEIQDQAESENLRETSLELISPEEGETVTCQVPLGELYSSQEILNLGVDSQELPTVADKEESSPLSQDSESDTSLPDMGKHKKYNRNKQAGVPNTLEKMNNLFKKGQNTEKTEDYDMLSNNNLKPGPKDLQGQGMQDSSSSQLTAASGLVNQPSCSPSLDPSAAVFQPTEKGSKNTETDHSQSGLLEQQGSPGLNSAYKKAKGKRHEKGKGKGKGRLKWAGDGEAEAKVSTMPHSTSHQHDWTKVTKQKTGYIPRPHSGGGIDKDPSLDPASLTKDEHEEIQVIGSKLQEYWSDQMEQTDKNLLINYALAEATIADSENERQANGNANLSDQETLCYSQGFGIMQLLLYNQELILRSYFQAKYSPVLVDKLNMLEDKLDLISRNMELCMDGYNQCRDIIARDGAINSRLIEEVRDEVTSIREHMEDDKLRNDQVPCPPNYTRKQLTTKNFTASTNTKLPVVPLPKRQKNLDDGKRLAQGKKQMAGNTPPIPLLLESYATWKTKSVRLGFDQTLCSYQLFLSLKNKNTTDNCTTNTCRSSASGKSGKSGFLASCVRASNKNKPPGSGESDTGSSVSGSEDEDDEAEPSWISEVREGLQDRSGDLKRIRTFMMKMVSNHEQTLGKFFKGKSLSSLDEKEIMRRIQKAISSFSECGDDD